MPWTFDRLTRYEAIIERHVLMAEYLRHSIRDTPKGSADRNQLARRLAIVEPRLAWFRTVARVSRHNARRAARPEQQLATV